MKPARIVLLAATILSLTACSTAAPTPARTVVVTVTASSSAASTPKPINIGSYYLDSVCPQNQEDVTLHKALSVSTLDDVQQYAQTDEAFAEAASQRLSDPSVEFPPATRSDLKALVKHLQAKEKYLGEVASARSLKGARAAKVPAIKANTFGGVRAALGLSLNTVTSCAAHVGSADTVAVVAPKPKPKPVPVEYLSALTKAEEYGTEQYLSKAGIYDQLTSQYGEGFSKKAAKYALKHVRINWNKNALEKAKEYQSEQSMSPYAIRDQLTSSYGEKFTASQADYAIKHLND